MSATIIDFPAPPAVQSHTVSFARHRLLGFQARCTCGWSVAGIDLRRIECMAAVHDLDDGDAA